MATSDEQFERLQPYHPDMTVIPASELLQRALSDPTMAGATPPCLDEVEIARIAEGGAAGDAAIAHLAGCGACREQLAALVALLGDPHIAAEVNRIHRTARRPARPLLVSLGVAAAAAVVMLVASPRGPPVDPDPRRDQVLTATSSPVLLSPVGEVGQVPILVWSRVDGAGSYRATLFDSTGSVLFEIQRDDTTAVMPDSVRLVPRRTYLWKVEARTGWDRWSASELARFRIVPAPGLPAAPRPLAASPTPPSPPDPARLLPAGFSERGSGRAPPTGSAELREAFRSALAGAVRGDSSHRAGQLLAAWQLAGVYQVAWRDDFLAREAARFTRWSPARRADRVWVDSVRLAGGAAYGRDGPRAAIAIWHRALSRAQAIPDSAGMAALLGNIGAALARESQRDSAADYLTHAQRLAEAAGDLRVAANAMAELADLSEQREDVAGARELYARAIELRGRIGDSRGLAADYNNIASLARAAGDVHHAREQLEAALAINRREGHDGPAATNLVNLAALAAADGAFGRADEDYREALAIWRATGDSAEAASALDGLGELSVRRGDYPAAVQWFRAAAQILDRTGPVVDALAVRQRLAAALAAQGRLQDAADELRRVKQVGEMLRLPPEAQGDAALARADLAIQLLAFAEAEAHYASAAALFGRAGVLDGVAAAQHGLGILYGTQGNTRRATELLDAALRTQVGRRDGRGAALTRMALGSVAAQAGDSSGARRHLEGAAAEFNRLGDPVGNAAALHQLAEVEAAAGRPAAAESHYRAALARLGARVAPDVSWRLHAGLAGARLAFGSTEEAARELRASITDIERVGESLRLPEVRSAVLADKWVVYQRLAALEHGRGRTAASFAVSEALRAREMAELLARGRVAAPRDLSARLVFEEQDLRRRVGELTRAVEGAVPDRRDSRGPWLLEAGAVTREALLQAQASLAAVQREIRERAPRHAAWIAPEVVTWQGVAQRLRPDEAMLEYLLTEAGAMVYVITRDTLAGIPLGVGQRELARRVDFARGALHPRGSRLDSLWRAPLRELHRDLIEPVEATGLLAGKTRLTIVPHAELHYLPFAALVEREQPTRFLVERYQLSVTPSASVWVQLGRDRGRAIGSGTLALAPHPERLPASRQDIATLPRSAGRADWMRTGSAATESAFRREAPTRRLIHLATFGVLNKQNPLFSFIDLAPDREHDGRLEVHEVFGLTLVADLVVLSACQTALGSGALTDVPAGDDWVGLSRAFLTAGARHVMASLWAVEDRATATLMQRFYQRYTPGGDPATTLAGAQRAMLASPATAHPYYWAGFEVIGGR